MDGGEPASTPLLPRRDFLRLAGLAGVVVACNAETGDPATPTTATSVTIGPDLPTDPFALGVASGDPLHDRVVIWTRLAPEPLEGEGCRIPMPRSGG